MNFIAKFNPYDMSDHVIMAVATARKKILSEVIEVLEDNLNSDGARQHLLVLGPRGMGKSFFLKYLKVQFNKKPAFQNCQYVLLPEEQNNMNSASDFVNMIMDQVDEGGTKNVFTSWEETDEQWSIAYKRLTDYLIDQKEKNKQFLLVAVVENFNDFLIKIKDNKVAQSRIRILLEKLENFTLIGASPFGNIDSNYNQRIFKAFKEYKLSPWKEEDYLRYFERRRKLHEETSNIQLSQEQKQLQNNKLKAISKFTGGSPRMAVVLTELILNEDVFSTANTLYGLIDDLTPYYQDLTKSMRPQSRKLFDTLIRAGENKSQSELAAILNTTQNKISKPFIYLQENGFVSGKKRSKEKSFYYSATDRIFVLYYHRREIYHNQSYTPIWLLSDFLLAFFQKNELKEKAMEALKDQPADVAIDLAKISLLARGYHLDRLPKSTNPKDWLKILEEPAEYMVLPQKIQTILASFKDLDVSTEDLELDQLLDTFSIVFQKELTEKEQEKIGINILTITSDLANKKHLHKVSVEILSKMIELTPSNQQQGNSFIFYNLTKGVFLSVLGEIEKSIDLLQKYLPHVIDRPSTYLKILIVIGSNYERLQDFERAINTYQKGLASYVTIDDKAGQAKILKQIGNCFEELRNFKDALAAHEKSLVLFNELKDKEGKALALENIGISLTGIGKSEDALTKLNEALTLRRIEKNTSRDFYILSYIGLNLNGIFNHKKAIKVFNEAYDIIKNKKNPILIIWAIGDLCCSYLLNNEPKLAWKLLDRHTEKEEIFKEFGTTIKIKENHKGQPAAFKLALEILHGLKERAVTMNVPQSLSNFFAKLLSMGVPNSLLQDITEEAKDIFPNPEAQIIINAAMHAVEFILAKKDPAYLEKLSPDEAITIQAIIAEANL